MIVIALRKNLFMFFALLGIAPLRADFPKPIAPPKIETPSKIGSTTPSVVAPVAIPSTASGTIPISPPRHPLLSALLDKMKSGQLSPQQAWDDKLIDVDDLLWLHLNSIDAWGGFYWEKNLPLRRALTKLLAEKGGEKLQPIEKLSPSVRLWLADYYGSIGDGKCVTLCDGILSEIKLPVKGENALVFQTIERLGWFYSSQGEHEKAGRAWERIGHAHSSSGWWTGDSQVLAALEYLSTGKNGDAKRADVLFKEAVQSKLPISDFSLEGLQIAVGKRLAVGQTQEAITFLQSLLPLAKDKAPLQLVIEDRLGECYWRKRDLAAAQKHFAQVVNFSEKLSKSPLIAVDNGVSNAKAKLHKIEKWNQAIVISDTPQIDLIVWGKAKDYHQIIYLNSAMSMPLEVSCDNPHVKARLGNKWQIEADGITEKVNLHIEIPANALGASFDAFLTLRSKRHPQWKLEIPIYVDVRLDLPADEADEAKEEIEWIS